MEAAETAAAKSGTTEWSDVLFEYMCTEGHVAYPLLVLSSAVCRGWRSSCRRNFHGLEILHFGTVAAQTSDAVVLHAVSLAAGASLRIVNLRGCNLSVTGIKAVMRLIASSCPRVVEIDLTHCPASAALGALAFQAQRVFSTPLDLYAHMIKGGSKIFGGKSCMDMMECCHYFIEHNETRLGIGELVFGKDDDKSVVQTGANLMEVPMLGSDEEDEFRDSDSEETSFEAKHALFAAIKHKDAWVVALLLSVHFPGAGDFEKCYDAVDCHGRGALNLAALVGDVESGSLLLRAGVKSRHDKKGNQPLLTACEVGSSDFAKLLLERHGAIATIKNNQGKTPLLAACGSGDLHLAQMLLDFRANVNDSNIRGETPLLGACNAGYQLLVEHLIRAGADTAAIRQDGACAFAVAIMRDNTAISELVFNRHPKRIEAGAQCDITTYVQQLAHAFLDPSKIQSWLHDGASAHGLKGEIGMLVSSPAVETSLKDQLCKVRAFLEHHTPLLNLRAESDNDGVDPYGYRLYYCTSPVQYPFAQLAMQAPDDLFRRDGDAPSSLDVDTAAAHEAYMIQWLNKPQAQYPCQWSIDTGYHTVACVSFSPADGNLMARAEGNNVRHYTDVVLCNPVTGLEVRRLTEHMGWVQVESRLRVLRFVCRTDRPVCA